MLIYHCSGFQPGKASEDWWQTSDTGYPNPWNGTCSYYTSSHKSEWYILRVMGLYFMSQNRRKKK